VEFPTRKSLFATPTRRRLLGASAALVAAPYVLSGRANAAGQLMVRTPGGAFDDVKRKTVYDPFRQETGIEVVPVPATVGKMLAMFKAGQFDLDCIDTGNDALLQLEGEGALQTIDYKSFKYTDVDDIEPNLKLPYQVGTFVYSFVLCYNKTAYSTGSEPKSWAEFWDTKAFPGPRTMAGMESGAPNLEIALIADGVPMDKVYPIDLDRAFKSLTRIKPSIAKFWDTGALSAQMMADKEAVLGVLWNTRVQAAIDGGAPLGMQWNQNQVLVQSYGIPKGSKNLESALKFIDYSLSPVVQARWLAAYQAIPVNKKAYPSTSKAMIDPATGTPWTVSKGFMNDIKWWAQNRAKVSAMWSNWVL
jgi:putative spermidine/putrescine transport system substrate-binding protein